MGQNDAFWAGNRAMPLLVSHVFSRHDEVIVFLGDIHLTKKDLFFLLFSR